MKDLKKEGHKVKLLDGEPDLNQYEIMIISAANICETYTDIHHFMNDFGVIDKEEFFDIVIHYKSEMNKVRNDS